MIDRKAYIEQVIAGAHLFKRQMSMHTLLKDADITGSQWLVVAHIGEHEGANTNETATALNMSGSAVTQLVNALVDKGFLKRMPDPLDRRAHKLMLSADSKKRIAAFKQKHAQMFLKMFEVLTDKEFEQYIALNSKIFNCVASKKT